MLVARSPIAPPAPVITVAGWEMSNRASSSPLTICDQSPLSKVHIRALKRGLAEKSIAVPFGRSEHTDGGDLVVGSGPGEWLILGAIGTVREMIAKWEEALAHAADSGEHVSVLDLTHGRALVRLRGQASPHLLAKVCAIDLSEEVTPNGSALRTSVAKLVTDIVRDDQEGQPSFLLHCERSSGQYLFDALRDAGTEFGIDTRGFAREPTMDSRA